MKYYKDFFLQWKDKTIDHSSLIESLENNTIEDIYYEVMFAKQTVDKIEPLLVANNSIDDVLVNETRKNIDMQINAITQCFENWFKQHTFLGDASACHNPDCIIVLGCNRPLLDLRIHCAIAYARKFPNAHMLFSGGGFSIARTESAFMQSEFQKSGLKNQTYMEEISMDTIGNALFSKFYLEGKHLLKAGTRIVIITSNFHAVRALRYFETIFNTGEIAPYVIATKGVETPSENLQKLASHELHTEYEVTMKAGILGMFDNKKYDQQDILLNLFLYHDLYRNRYDLLRKFLKNNETNM